MFVGIAVGLVWFLLDRDHGEKEPVGALWLAAGLGLLGSLLAAWLENRFIPIRDLLPSAPHATLLLASLSVGIFEESCKFLPLALVLYKKPYFNEHTDGIIYFALAGLGFGLPENLLYTVEFGAKAGLVRLFMTPFFHAATTGLIGYFLIKQKLAGLSPISVLPALVFIIIIHSLYDFGLVSGAPLYGAMSLLITLCVSIGLFVAFQRANESDQSLGISTMGHNAFCRSCGFPNPRHHLYCVRCGKNA